MVIEIDGSSHNDKHEYDATRDEFLKGLRLQVIHIPDADIKKNLQSVMDMLYNHPAFTTPSLHDTPPMEGNVLHFSTEAKNVFAAGKALWKYYHKQPNCNVNASLYDIREHFQGRNDKGKMNAKSNDEDYMKLIKSLREQLHNLAIKIQPKVYTYGFLKV